MGAIALILFSILPSDGDPVRETVDLVEINRTYCDKGKLCFHQVIFWEHRGGVYRVVAWKLAKEGIIPRKDHRTGEWVSLWIDGNTFREVRAPWCRETWTQGTPQQCADPEAADRKVWPKQNRRELLNVGN